MNAYRHVVVKTYIIFMTIYLVVGTLACWVLILFGVPLIVFGVLGIGALVISLLAVIDGMVGK